MLSSKRKDQPALTGAELIASVTLAQATVTVPHWGAMNVRELLPLEAKTIEEQSGQDGYEAMFWYVRYGVIDDKGDHLFRDEDIVGLRGLSISILKPLAERVRDLSGLKPDAVAVALKKTVASPEDLIWHRLGLAVGELDIERLKLTVKPRTFTAWRAYFIAEPYHVGFALLASLLAEAHRNTEKRTEPFTAEDFMPVAILREAEGPQLGDMDEDGFSYVEGGHEMLSKLRGQSNGV